MQTTFAEQAAEYLKQAETGREPVAANTLKAYKSYLKARLIPEIGSVRLQGITDVTLKGLMDRICPELKPATISGIRNVFQGVMDSAVDETGKQLCRREWNWGFIQPPAVVPAEQNTPEIAQKTLQEAISGGSGPDRLLWALLAGSGLRISEALAVTIAPDGTGNYWNPAEKTIAVACQRHPGDAVGSPKTASGARTVDLCSQLNRFMLAQLPATPELFRGSHEGFRDRLNKAVPKTGFHAFRRFRLTHVASSGVPETLDRFWSGHAAKDVHGRYAKWASKIAERREWAEKIGLGFELPA
jgi:integrase